MEGTATERYSNDTELTTGWKEWTVHGMENNMNDTRNDGEIKGSKYR